MRQAGGVVAARDGGMGPCVERRAGRWSGQGKGSAAQRSVRDAGVEEEADEAVCGGMRQSGMARDVGARGWRGGCGGSGQRTALG